MAVMTSWSRMKREDSHQACAAQAAKRIDLEDALQEYRPPLSHGLQCRPVRDVGKEPGEELERREDMRAGSRAVALVRAKRHLLFAGVVVQPVERDGGAGGVASELEDAAGVVGFQPHRMVDVKSRVGPLQHRVGLVIRMQIQPHELAEDTAPKCLREDFDLVVAQRQEGAVGHQAVQVRMPVQQRSERLDGSDDPRSDVRLLESGAHEVAQRPVGDAAHHAEQPAVVREERPQALGNGEHVLPVRDSIEEFVLEPVGPDLESLSVA
jgi:hypothetical protein